MAGVAFSKLSQADNVGYIIPWKIVAHFMREYEEHGVFRGCCSVGFRWQDMENTHMREHYKACLPHPVSSPACRAPNSSIFLTFAAELLCTVQCQLYLSTGQWRAEQVVASKRLYIAGIARGGNNQTGVLFSFKKSPTMLQVPPNGSGSLVFKIDPMAPATSVLKENDVVLEIEGVPIADDGTVEFRNEERVEFSHIVRSKHIGAPES